MRYRPEIDGLRAVAVVPVILFHAGFQIFSGGFVGVDVFFVISGYLITTILINDLARGTFSILRFYERRARRILPALTFVMLCCLPFAWAWMLPDQQVDLARSIVAVAIFMSNILFWREENYFAAAAEEKPLLHTWSLAVEEQYYLFFPPFLWLCWRFGRQPAFWILAVLAALSLALSEWGWRNMPSANFFLLPSRAWELFAGSLCAFVLTRPEPPRGNALLGGLGLAMILASVFLYDSTVPFPSVYALLPVGGTMLVILFARSGAGAGRLLALGPVVGIGLISYSAYLWHQPLFAFARIRLLEDPSAALMLGLSVLALGLAWGSWRFVEQPFRGRTPLLPGRRAVLGTSLATLVGLTGLGVLLASPAALWPKPGATQARVAAQIEDWQDRDPCSFDGGIRERRAAECLAAATDPVILYGDSHAGALSAALRASMAADGRTLISFSHGACLPVTGASRLPLTDNTIESCARFRMAVDAFLADYPDVPMVLVARWALHLSGTRFDNHDGGDEGGPPVPTLVIRAGQPDPGADLQAHVLARIAALSETRPLMVLTQVPEAGWNVGELVQKAAKYDIDRSRLATDQALYEARSGPFNRALEDLASDRISVLETAPIFCGTPLPGKCINAFEGRLYYRDDDHVSPFGAALIADAIRAALPPVTAALPAKQDL